MRLLRIPAVWLSLLACAVIAQTCYYPNGQVATGYTWVPCRSTGGTASSCCIPSEGDTCMSNGLCNWVGHYYFRGACTDQTWKDGSCAQVCQGDSPSSWVQLQKCTSGLYCCGSSSCCNNANAQFAVNGTSTATVAFLSATSSTTSRTTTSRTTTSSTTRTTSATTGLSATTGTGTTDTSVATGPVVSGTGTAAASSGGGSSGASTRDLGVAIGVGIGGSLIGAACGLAAIFLIRKDRKRKREAAAAAALDGGNNPGLPPTSPSTQVPAIASPAPTYQSPAPSPYPPPATGYYDQKNATQAQASPYPTPSPHTPPTIVEKDSRGINEMQA